MSNKLTQIIDLLEELKVGEMLELKNNLEERWGVTAAAAVAPAASTQAAAEEEDSEKEVVLTAMGDKIKTIKALRELNADLSLMDAKKIVEAISDAAPYSLGRFEKTKAEELVKKFAELQAAPKLK